MQLSSVAENREKKERKKMLLSVFCCHCTVQWGKVKRNEGLDTWFAWAIIPERMSAVRKFCYYSRWQYCHPGHATCSIQELFTVSGGLEMILPLKRCKEVSAHAKLFCMALQKDLFFPWEVTKKFWSTMQISFPGQLRKKIFSLLIFLFGSKWARILSQLQWQSWDSDILITFK